MRKIIYAALVGLLVAGCSSPVDVSQGHNGDISVGNGGWSGSITIVTLEDGTKCAVLIGYSKGGIHCDWKGN